MPINAPPPSAVIRKKPAQQAYYALSSMLAQHLR